VGLGAVRLISCSILPRGSEVFLCERLFCEHPTVCIDVNREYGDCLGLLDGLEALEKFGAIRRLVLYLLINL